MQPGAAPALGPIAFVGHRVVDEARGDIAPAAAELRLLHCDRDREMRDRVEEVRGAVERIDDETRLARVALDHPALFEHEAPARTIAAEFVIERALGGRVGLRHEVCGALLRDLQMLDLAEVAAQLGARLARGAFHDGDDARYGHFESPPSPPPPPRGGGGGGGGGGDERKAEHHPPPRTPPPTPPPRGGGGELNQSARRT